MASANLQDIARTLGRLAAPGMKPKELMRSVREVHPEATKKEVVRAAFFAVIEHSADDAERAGQLHDFALRQRTDFADPAGTSGDAPPRKSHRKRGAKV